MSFRSPPDHYFLTQTGPLSWEARRPTDEELAVIRRDYPEWCAEQIRKADLAAEDGEGLTAEDWANEPDEYRGECFKTCYSVQVMKKGAPEEFGVHGVYVCQGCGYAYPPDCEPAEDDGLEEDDEDDFDDDDDDHEPPF